MARLTASQSTTSAQSISSETVDAHLGKPVLSIVIPSYNRSALLARCLRSVLAQRTNEVEIIVVDDGSTDDTREMLRRDFGERDVVVVLQENAGPPSARNHGVRVARGEYVIFIDSDDEPLAEWLSAFLAAIRAERSGLISCGAIWLHNNDCATHARIALPSIIEECGQRPGCYLSGTYAMRRAIYLELGGMATGAVAGQHHELMYRFFQKYPDGITCTIDRPLLVSYRDSADGLRASHHRVRDGAMYYLSQHGTSLRRRHPAAFATRCGVAAVSAARVGDMDNARKYSRMAVSARPWNLKAVGRMLLMHVPAAARRRWPS